MLILTRRLGETIIIGEKGEIEVTVLGVKGNQVRLGVNADRNVAVHRKEIYDRIQGEQNGTNNATSDSDNSEDQRGNV